MESNVATSTTDDRAPYGGFEVVGESVPDIEADTASV